MLKSLTGPLGTFIKGFVTAVLSTLTYKYQTEGVLCNTIECLTPVMWSALFATLPVILNWFNPEYKEYGRNKSEKPML